MERNVKEKVNVYCDDFKSIMQKWFEDNNAIIQNTETGEDITTSFMSYMLDYPNLNLTSDDFKKRKRVKNVVPNFCRCVALKFDGSRCSRRRKDENSTLCGTHIKGTAFGVVDDDNEKEEKIEKIKLWLEEINGISQYIDDKFNVYSTEDIMNNVEFPRIIAKYERNTEGTYSIVNA
jgi:hypothetical protein